MLALVLFGCGMLLGELKRFWLHPGCFRPAPRRSRCRFAVQRLGRALRAICSQQQVPCAPALLGLAWLWVGLQRGRPWEMVTRTGEWDVTQAPAPHVRAVEGSPWGGPAPQCSPGAFPCAPRACLMCPRAVPDGSRECFLLLFLLPRFCWVCPEMHYPETCNCSVWMNCVLLRGGSSLCDLTRALATLPCTPLQGGFLLLPVLCQELRAWILLYL